MANYIIIGGDQKEYGPIPEAQLRQWIADRRVDARSKVRSEGETGWKCLSDFPEFGDLVKNSIPPPLSAAVLAKNPKTSGLAIASLVLGISGLVTCGLTSLVGLILGLVAMGKVKNSGGKLSGHGLALAGTIVSGVLLVLIPVFAVLGGMLLPALAAAKQKAQAINCVNNEKQLALAVKIYSGDHTNHFPPAGTWSDAIKTYAGSEKIFHCPAAPSSNRCDYAFNAKLDGLDSANVNPGTVLIFEAAGGWNANGGSELLPDRPRHRRVVVVAFADGSVHQLKESELSTLRWDP